MTVEVRCPHCGFSRNVPREKIPPGVRRANCPQCKKLFDLNLQMPAPPPGDKDEAAGKDRRSPRGDPPWERRSELGLWAAVYGTTKAVLFKPRELFAGMGFQAGAREPLAYGLLTGSLGTMVGFFWQFLWMSGAVYSLIGRALEGISMELVFAACLILSPLYVFVMIYLVSLFLHACLLLVRAGKNGFQATFRVIAYSQGTQVLAFIPFVGGAAGLVWQCVVQMIGLREIHEVSYGRIILAFLIPFVLFLLAITGLTAILSFLFLR
ncbi:MAG: YIP1 family protein [Thermodesulfobacteriota bacterium]